MFISKTKKSPFYQLTFEVDGKRTTISTRITNKIEAVRFREEFKKTLDSSAIVISPCKTKPLTKKVILLSHFTDEYLEYNNSVKSKSYLISIHYAFKYFISFCEDVPINLIDTRTVDKLINTTYKRTQRGAHQYYRTLKAAFSKAVEWNYIPVNPFTKVKFQNFLNHFRFL